MNYIARVSPRMFAAATIWMARRDVRYYLCGVAIQPHPEKGALLIATDGHTAAAFHDVDGWCKRDIIVGSISKALIAACKVSAKGKTLPPRNLWIAQADPSQGGAVLQGALWTSDEPASPPNAFDADVLHLAKVDLVDGKFPDWRKAFFSSADHATDQPGRAAVNPAYLARIDATAKALGVKHSSVVSYAKKPNEVILYRLNALDLSDRILIAIMPMQSDIPADPIPEAFKVSAKPIEKASSKPRVQVRGSEVVTQEETEGVTA